MNRIKNRAIIVLLGLVFLTGCDANIEKIRMKANKLYMIGEYEKAIEIHKKIIKKYPDSPLANQSEAEIKAIEGLVMLRKSEKARRLYDAKKYEEAMLEYEKLVKKCLNISIADQYVKTMIEEIKATIELEKLEKAKKLHYTKEDKERNLKGILRLLRGALETYRSYSKSDSYPSTLDKLKYDTETDVGYRYFLETIPVDPFYGSNAITFTKGTLTPGERAIVRDTKISGGGGWAYDPVGGRVCVNVKSIDPVSDDIIDTTWGDEYNSW